MSAIGNSIHSCLFYNIGVLKDFAKFTGKLMFWRLRYSCSPVDCHKQFYIEHRWESAKQAKVFLLLVKKK